MTSYTRVNWQTPTTTKAAKHFDKNHAAHTSSSQIHVERTVQTSHFYIEYKQRRMRVNWERCRDRIVMWQRGRVEE